MVEAIGGISHVTAGLGSMPASETLGVQEVSLRQPTGAEAADFARALTTSNPAEMRAMLPASTDGLVNRLSQQADDLSAHLRGLDPAAKGADISAPPGAAAAAPGGTAERDKLNEAVAQIEKAYMFAIETTMASRGSTETTKIFNTLLKGQ